METKHCPKCNETKSVDEFSRFDNHDRQTAGELIYQNPTGGTVDSENAILKLSSAWNDHDIVSTTSYSVYDYKWGLDADMGPLNIIAVDNDVDFKSVSHEVTISSPADDTFEYIVGIYVDDIHYDGINDGYFDMTAGGLFPQLFPAPNLVALASGGAAPGQPHQ